MDTLGFIPPQDASDLVVMDFETKRHGRIKVYGWHFYEDASVGIPFGAEMVVCEKDGGMLEIDEEDCLEIDKALVFAYFVQYPDGDL